MDTAKIEGAEQRKSNIKPIDQTYLAVPQNIETLTAIKVAHRILQAFTGTPPASAASNVVM